MHPYHNNYGLESVPKRKDLVDNFKKRKSEEAKKKKHATSEQRRRKRIKDYINRLRYLLIRNMPSKATKSTVVTETVRQVKELRKRAAELGLQQDEQGWLRGDGGGRFGLEAYVFPGECDEATVSYCEGGDGKMVKTTVCCEDRPGLNRDLTEAIRSAGATAVRAEMVTVGGRTKAEVVVKWREKGGGGEEDVGSLRRALKALVCVQASAHSTGFESPTNESSGLFFLQRI